jgi:hypothetical protein
MPIQYHGALKNLWKIYLRRNSFLVDHGPDVALFCPDSAFLLARLLPFFCSCAHACHLVPCITIYLSALMPLPKLQNILNLYFFLLFPLTFNIKQCIIYISYPGYPGVFFDLPPRPRLARPLGLPGTGEGVPWFIFVCAFILA